MNWEEQSMNSNRLFFNAATARNTLRRCWPMWAIYLGYLILSFTLPLTNYLSNPNRHHEVAFFTNFREQILRCAVEQAEAGVVVGILAVMVIFSYLYSSRGNTLMNSLPIRRESLFLTMYLTGLVPLLLCQILVTGITLPFVAGKGIEASYTLTWFAAAALSLVAFYGFAVFCAMLTGNIVILPLVYLVLNLAAWAFETCVCECLNSLVYGMSYDTLRFDFLSPIVKISNGLQVKAQTAGQVQLEGLEMLVFYAAAGLVAGILAMLMYRRRRMETVADFVAIPVLKPIFRYCMGFGTAFVFAAAVFDNFFDRAVSGSGAAWLMLGLMLVGAFLGWLAAEMMIRRSVRAFPLPWRGLLIVCATCAVMVLTVETDLTGYEKRVPDPELVESIEFCFDTVLAEPENIQAMTELHRRIIDDKPLFDVAEEGYTTSFVDEKLWDTSYEAAPERNDIMSFWLPLRYIMKDGSILQRAYVLHFSPGDADRPDSLIAKVVALLNVQEGIQSRMQTSLPMAVEYVGYAVISKETADDNWQQYRLTPKETVDLWNSAMLLDAEEGRLCLYTIVDTPQNLSTQTNLRIEINLFDEQRQSEPYYWYHSFRVFTFSEHCLDWIGTHTDLDWTNMEEIVETRQKN